MLLLAMGKIFITYYLWLLAMGKNTTLYKTWNRNIHKNDDGITEVERFVRQTL